MCLMLIRAPSSTLEWCCNDWLSEAVWEAKTICIPGFGVLRFFALASALVALVGKDIGFLFLR